MATESITEGWLKKHVPITAGGGAPELDAHARPRRVFDSTLPGFGVVIGSRFATFIARGRVEVNGETIRRDVTIGRWQHVGAGEDRSERWTEAKARKRAMHELGKIAHGEDPVEPEVTLNGPTLKDGLEIHVSNMRKTGGKGRLPNGEPMPCSPRSIRNVEDEVGMHLAAWLDRPIVELTALELTKLIDEVMVKQKEKPRAGTANAPGAALAKRLVRHVSAIWESTDKLHDLPAKNPAGKVTVAGLAPKKDRIERGGFVTWRRKVMALPPVRRDFNLLALHTSIRSEGLRHMTWEDVDLKERVLHVTRAKGNRPYSIPMTKTVEKILRGRRRDNKKQFALYGGDHGFVLPTVTRSKPFEVIPLSNPKQYVVDEEGNREISLLGPHALRRTWNSVAIEARIPPDDREALMNHEDKGVNLKHYGQPRSWDGLRESARAVEQRLLGLLSGKIK
jgi:integrase